MKVFNIDGYSSNFNKDVYGPEYYVKLANETDDKGGNSKGSLITKLQNQSQTPRHFPMIVKGSQDGRRSDKITVM